MANRITRAQAFQAVDFLRQRASNGVVEPVPKSTLLKEVSRHLGVHLTDGNLKGVLDDAKEMGVDISKLVKETHDRNPFISNIFKRLDRIDERLSELDNRIAALESELT